MATRFWGAMVTDPGPDGSVRLKFDEADWRLQIHPGERDETAYLGWGVAPADVQLAARADVETATVVRLGERAVAMVTIVLVRPPYEEVMAGAAVVRSAGDHDAVARAVLHAVNRRLPQLP